MKEEVIANKSCRFGLYNLALERIKECNNSDNIISFPFVFEKLCCSFSIKKKEAWELLFILRDFDMVEIVPYHGVKIK